MNINVLILGIAWILTITMLIVFVPKNKVREAQVIFFFKQMITWISGLVVAQYGLVEYPVREFANATKASFCFEYFVYPSICVVFNLYYPEHRSRIKQFLYYIYYCTVMTIIEVLCEKYTNLVAYIHWTWYVTWLTFFVTFYISRKYYVWFFRKYRSV